MRNSYEVRGDTTAIFINSTRYGKFETLISTNKLPIVMEFPNTWLAHNNKSLYVMGHLPRNGEKQKSILLHRFLLAAPDESIIDHINHNTLDNTDGNLRICTEYENNQNRGRPNRNSRSGVRGIWWDERAKKWQAQVIVNYKRIRIGSFSDKSEAEKAVIKARQFYMPFSELDKKVSELERSNYDQRRCKP